MAKKPKEEIHPRKKPKPLPVRYTPNVTPLIDVMFLLLLFFLLTTKFRQEEGAIPGTLPALGKSFGGAAAEELPPPINVTINPVGDANVEAAYQVSGEYSAIRAAASLGYLDERRAVIELTSAIKRAGADLIITYFAQQLAGWL